MNADNWYAADTATFGDRLAAAREEAGLDQAEFAARLGVAPDTVRDWEEDRSEPRANRLSMMAGLLNVSVMWLLNGEGDGVSAPGEGLSQPDARALAELRVMRELLGEALARAARLERMLREPQG